MRAYVPLRPVAEESLNGIDFICIGYVVVASWVSFEWIRCFGLCGEGLVMDFKTGWFPFPGDSDRILSMVG